MTNNTQEQQTELNAAPAIDYTQGLAHINARDIRTKHNKRMIFGLQGSGKTFFTKQLNKMNGLRTLVYSPHYHDFKEESDLFIYYKFKDFYEEFETFIQLAIELGKAGQIDNLLIDEFDMLFKAGKTRGKFFVDFAANHRHYNLGADFLARRPQDIDALIVESCEYLIGFSIFGDNVKQKLNRIYKNFGNMVQSLKKGEHKAVILEIGYSPKLMQPIEEIK